MRNLITRLIAVGFGLLLAWLLIELVLRLMPGLLPPAVQEVTGREPRSLSSIDRFYQTWLAAQMSDPVLGVRSRPNLDIWLEGHPDFSYRLRTNSHGLRNDREQGPVDAILLGDSFAFGYGVNEEDTWAARLSELSGIEFVNLGVSGLGAVRELRLLETEGLPLQPKLVVWQFFKNDPWDASRFQQWQASGNPDFMAWEKEQYSQPKPAAQGSGVGWAVRRFLYRHVISYELVKYALGIGVYTDQSEQRIRVVVDGKPLLLEQTLNRTWGDFSQPDIEQGWRLTQESLLQARDLVEAAGAKFAVVMVPSKEEVYWHLLAPRLDDPEGMHMLEPSRRLAEFCRQEGIPYLDLQDRMAAAAQQGQVLYLTYDAHWNPAGHALAAEILNAFLKEQDLLP